MAVEWSNRSFLYCFCYFLDRRDRGNNEWVSFLLRFILNDDVILFTRATAR
jgi:hypothetical protein